MDISERIKAIRKEKKITQSEIAERIGLKHQSNYARLENRGNKLSYEEIQKFASALGVSVQYLLFGEEQKNCTECEKEKKQLYETIARQKSEFISVINSVLENYLKMAVSGFVSIQEGLFMQTLDKTFSELLQADLPNSDKIFLIVQKILKDFEANQIKPEYEVIIASLFFPFSSIDFDYYIKSGYIKSPAVINAYRYFKEKILSNE